MAKQPEQQVEETPAPVNSEPVRYCGIIMPIAAMPPEYEVAHWVRVKGIISDAITESGFTPRLVSESDEIGVIHGQIVQNLYDDEVVVCDVSGKNPNVMFELGLRLAFDKPTIIVQDDSNGYSFDIGPIKHIGYRKDQRFDDVEEFRKKVATAINATVAKKQDDANFSPFLKHFGHFTPKKVEDHEIPQADFIMKKLASIEHRINQSMHMQERALSTGFRFGEPVIPFEDLTAAEANVVKEMRDRIRMIARKRPKTNDLQAKAEIKRYVYERVTPREMSDERLSALFDTAWTLEANPNPYSM